MYLTQQLTYVVKHIYFLEKYFESNEARSGYYLTHFETVYKLQ
jgi:hypothetical protein